jgi:DNA processing protein
MRRKSTEGEVSDTVAPPDKAVETSTLQWLALALTPGLGPTKARRLAEFFGGVKGVFRASLTELEAFGIQAVSAQSLGTGRSMELAQDESARASAAGVRVITLEDALYPPSSSRFMTHPWFSTSAEPKA